MAWIKRSTTKIGSGEAVDLTVSNGTCEFTGSVNLSIQSEINDFISKAKAHYTKQQEGVSADAAADVVVQTIISELNK